MERGDLSDFITLVHDSKYRICSSEFISLRMVKIKHFVEIFFLCLEMVISLYNECALSKMTPFLGHHVCKY
jgi:hypothetical protein